MGGNSDCATETTMWWTSNKWFILGRKEGRGLCTDMTNVHSVNVVNFKYSWKIIINYGAVINKLQPQPGEGQPGLWVTVCVVVIVAAPWWWWRIYRWLLQWYYCLCYQSLITPQPPVLTTLNRGISLRQPHPSNLHNAMMSLFLLLKYSDSQSIAADI